MGLPVQRRDGAFWRRPKPMAGVLVSPRESGPTSSGAKHGLPHLPATCDGGQGRATMGWEAGAVTAPRPGGEGAETRVRPRPPTALAAQHARWAGGAAPESWLGAATGGPRREQTGAGPEGTAPLGPRRHAGAGDGGP